MPYISKDLRYEIDNNRRVPLTEGDLNYRLTTVCLKYLEVSGTSYHTLNEIIGALECCKLEFYRRACASYEDKKMDANGDVYP